MKLTTFFSNPKVMARSGIIAMGLKLVIASALAILMSICCNTNAFFACTFILYPVVALIFDLILYFNKEKIWTILPNDTQDNWQITPEQLLEYAKNLPKIRLIRFLFCWIGIPFMAPDTIGRSIIGGMATLAIGFLFCSIFDFVWLKVFKITTPKIVFNNTIQQNNCIWMQEEDDDWDDAISRNSDATSPGSSAWFAQQAFNSRR